MKYSRIPKVETQIQEGNYGNYKLEAFSIPIKGEDSKLEGFTIRPSGKNARKNYFYEEHHPKEKIVLHYTIGNLGGDLGALTRQNEHVSVPFLIARDGTIYQLFSSGYWSYHLGPTAIGRNPVQSKKSIGIELSNYGPLTLRNGNLETYYSRTIKKKNGRLNVDIYCSESETDKYVKLDKPYRECSYFATFTDEQYESLIILLRYLTAQYDIPRNFLNKKDRFLATQKVIGFKGILSHVNFRKTGKTDLGPAFDWDRLIKGVKAKAYDEKTKTQMAIKETKAALKKAKEEMAELQTKIMNLEINLMELENPVEIAEMVISPTTKPHASEAAIEKAEPKKRKSRGISKRKPKAKVDPDWDGPEDSQEDLSSFYL